MIVVEWLVGIAAGLMSGCGVGGGTLLLLYLTAVAGVEQRLAAGVNLLYFLCCAPTALISHIRHKLVNFRVFLPAALAGGFMIAMSLVPPGGAAAPAVSRPLVELVTGALGSLGFGMVFRLRARYLVPAVLGGLLNWGTYLLAYSLTGALFLSCLLAAAVAAVYAEILAQRLRAPATLFLVPALIPSIPGSCLYYTMQAAVVGDFAAASQNGVLTLQWALGIAGGISIVVVILTVIRGVRKRQP